MLQPGDRVLLKASHSVAIDQIVAALVDRLGLAEGSISG
jgi:UDP-N-acetylmuramyl pentapeptide synthase